MSYNGQQKTRVGGANARVKAEVKEKVREIRLRQHNWMKQRDDQLKQPASPQEQAQSTKVRPQNIALAKQERRSKPSEQSEGSVSSSRTAIPSKGGFKSWLQARTPDSDAKTGETLQRGVLVNETVVTPGGGEVNLMRLNSARSVECATPEPGWRREEVLGPCSTRTDPDLVDLDPVRSDVLAARGDATGSGELSSGIIFPEQFDSLADEIIARVKKDLDINSRLVTNSHNENNHWHKTAKSYEDKFPACPPGGAIPSSTPLPNHNCPQCSCVMISPESSPMLLIPCGHTICNVCVKGRQTCPVCGCSLSSSMCNIMLQQIIEDFHQHDRREKTPLSLSSHNDRHGGQKYQPGLYTDTITDYREAYSNLKMRHTVLTGELEAVNINIDRISASLQKERRQLTNIGNEEGKLREEIQRLQSKLELLSSHKVEYQTKCDSLEREKDGETARLTMVKDTLRGIDRQMDKVRLLAEETSR